MIKHELIAQVADVCECPKAQALVAVDAVLGVISDALGAGEEVKLTRFGTFKVKSRPARTGRHPKTGEAITIPASRVVKFTPSPELL